MNNQGSLGCSHAPSTEHTALSELTRRHQAEIPIGNDAMAKDNLNDTGVVSLSQRTVEEFLQFSEAWFQPKLFAGFHSSMDSFGVSESSSFQPC